jgi:hypothetical protein
MPYAIHTVEIPDGGIVNNYDRVIIGGQIGVANAAGGAGASVTVPVTFPAQLGGLPPNYAVLVSPGQACFWSISAKTSTGFIVTLEPTSGSTSIAAGTIDVVVVG